MDEGDDTLVAAVRDGSERAFNVLVDRHQQAVRTFLRGITSWDDADDLAQDTFLAVWTHARNFRGGNVRAWLFSIAWRKAKGAQRRWFRGGGAIRITTARLHPPAISTPKTGWRFVRRSRPCRCRSAPPSSCTSDAA